MKRFFTLFSLIAISCLLPIQTSFAQSTPSWALGRTGSGLMQVDGGGTWGSITFDQEVAETTSPGNRLRCPGYNQSGCPTCNQIYWNTTFDNYLSGTKRDKDILELNTNINAKHLFLRNVVFQNAWQCSGGAWSGPNGISCPAGVKDTGHVDVFQIWKGPGEDGGWVVLQDSVFRNSDDGQIFHWTQPDFQRGNYNSPCTDPKGPGGIVLQNVTIEQTSEFRADCAARGNGATFPCQGNYWNFRGGGTKPDGWTYIWFIDVNSSNGPGLLLRDDPGIVMIVGQNNKGGRNNWPSPLGAGNGPGPGQAACDGLNGLLQTGGYESSNSSLFKIYCYDSIERALNDQSCPNCPHPRPPFLALSSAGWSNPPTNNNTLAPPTNLKIVN